MNRVLLAGMGLAILGLGSSRAYAEYDNRNGSVYIPQAIKDILKGPNPPKEVRYRLLFVTDDPEVATFNTFEKYDEFVWKQANENGSLLKGGAELDWRAIVSVKDAGGIITSAYNRLSSVFGTEGSDRPYTVYGTDGSKVATSYLGLFDPAQSFNTREFNQFGLTEGAALVWSGSNDNGSSHLALGGLATILGTYGVTQQPHGQWLRAGFLQQFQRPLGTPMRFYGISDVILVPEPASIAMWLGFAGVAGVCFWRRRRRAS